MKLAALSLPATPSLLTRRAFLLEMSVAAVAIAIPIVSIVTTAQPIPNPPGRDAKSKMSSAHQALKEQRREAEKSRRRSAKKRTRQKRSKRERRPE